MTSKHHNNETDDEQDGLDAEALPKAETLLCETATLRDQGPCDFQEDAARVVCLSGRWMVAVADGCSGGPDKGAAAVAAVDAAETAWRAGERSGGPEPDLAAMFKAADLAVLAVPWAGAADREKADSMLERDAGERDAADREAAVHAEMLQTETGRGSVYHPDHRDKLSPVGGGAGFWGPATTLTVAVWDRQQGLRWGACGDTWLFAVDSDGNGVALETPRLELSKGGCLGYASPRAVYGRIPNIDGWAILAATDGLYPALGQYEEEIVSTIEQSWRDTHHNVDMFLTSLFDTAETNGLFDNTTGAAVAVPA